MADVRRRGSPPFEDRLTLLHEGGAAFGVVLAGEAFVDDALAQCQIALARVLHRLAYNDLDRTHGQWRVRGDHLAIIFDVAFELISRNDLVDQAHAQSLLGAELTGCVEDLAGAGRPDEIDQLLDAVIGVAEPELGRRNTKARALGGNPQIARERRADAAAYAIAGDHRDRWFRGILDAPARALGDLAVGSDCFLRGAFFLELRDVGARHESPTAGAADDDHPYRIVLLEIVHDLGHGFPHFERHGIVARRVVEHQTADRSVLLGDHLGSRQRLVEHASRSLTHERCACQTTARARR